MSQAPRRHLRLENIDGVTVVSFVDTKIVTEENIQEVGDQLYSLVEDEGHKQLLLNFGNVQIATTAPREFFIRNTGEGLISVSLERGSPFDEAFSGTACSAA